MSKIDEALSLEERVSSIELGTTDRHTIDFGTAGGARETSKGENRFLNNLIYGNINTLHVNAENNWWGSPAGPNPDSFILTNGGTIDVEPFLIVDPGSQ